MNPGVAESVAVQGSVRCIGTRLSARTSSPTSTRTAPPGASALGGPLCQRIPPHHGDPTSEVGFHIGTYPARWVRDRGSTERPEEATQARRSRNDEISDLFR